MKEQVKHSNSIHGTIENITMAVLTVFLGRGIALWQLNDWPRLGAHCCAFVGLFLVGWLLALPWMTLRWIARKTVCPGYSEKYLRNRDSIRPDKRDVGLSLIVAIIVIGLTLIPWSERMFNYSLVMILISFCVTGATAYANLLVDFATALKEAGRMYRETTLARYEAEISDTEAATTDVVDGLETLDFEQTVQNQQSAKVG